MGLQKKIRNISRQTRSGLIMGETLLLPRHGMTKALYRQELMEALKRIIGNLSISQVAYKTGISYETVRKIVAYGHVPSEAMLERLASGLGVDMYDLKVAAGYITPRPPYAREFEEETKGLPPARQDQMWKEVQAVLKRYKDSERENAPQ
jgi:transcriptional regulator with XRE-family HTH domain